MNEGLCPTCIDELKCNSWQKGRIVTNCSKYTEHKARKESPVMTEKPGPLIVECSLCHVKSEDFYGARWVEVEFKGVRNEYTILKWLQKTMGDEWIKEQIR